MKDCRISVSSNNLKSIKHFLFFCFFNKNIDLLFIKKYFKRKQKKKILTILKSPHINKRAQEQFEQRIFVRKFTLYSQKLPQYILYLKKVKVHMFSDIKVEIKFVIQSSMSNVFCDLNNFNANIVKKISRLKTISKIKTLIKIIDIYGESLKQNKSKFG